ncbi:integrase, catalytic region, zinc finger, CCHC-type containing protein [Tanacetum coccineum]
MLGLDGAFMKEPFPGQVLAAVALDSNNGIDPLAHVLVEAESKSSWCWFLQCLSDDIDLHPNSNFTFISDRQKHGWCGQAYKDLLWISASATSVKEFEKYMLELIKMNPKAHEWLNKIPPEHWTRSHIYDY